ncbi:hypothetical protein LCGC14_3062510 [marine sediment metagenome]|uniref:Radical SAM core domain-containing protein n=1 Tax=marine sediment metagenome TaxID=412755 RepID=A0A0F8YR72_9ZZZZ
MDQEEILDNYDGVVKGLPEVVRIEPASLCNLKCIHCPTGIIRERKYRGIMSLDTFEIITKEFQYIKPRVVVLYHGGEPFLNKNIFHMIRQVKNLGISFVKTVTNGMLITEEMLGEIIESRIDSIEFSLDGKTADENNRIRAGSDYNKVSFLIKKLIELKHELNSPTPDCRRE